MQAGASTSTTQRVSIQAQTVEPASDAAQAAPAASAAPSLSKEHLTLPPPPQRHAAAGCLPIQPSTFSAAAHPTEIARDVLVRAIVNPASVQRYELAGALVELLGSKAPMPRKVDQLLVGFVRDCIESNRAPLLQLYVSTVASTLMGDANASRRLALLAGLASPANPETWQPFGEPPVPATYYGPPLFGRICNISRDWTLPLAQHEDDRGAGLNSYFAAVLASPLLSEKEVAMVITSEFTSAHRVVDPETGKTHHETTRLTSACQALDQGHAALVACVLHAIFHSDRSMQSKTLLACDLQIDWPALLIRLEILRASGPRHEWADGSLSQLEAALAAMTLGAGDGRVRVANRGDTVATQCHAAHLRAVGFEFGDSECAVVCAADAAIPEFDLQSPDREPPWWDEAGHNGKLHYRLPLSDLVHDVPGEAPATSRFEMCPVTQAVQRHGKECRVKLDSSNPQVLLRHGARASELDAFCKLASFAAVDFLVGPNGRVSLLCRSRIYFKHMADSLLGERAVARLSLDDTCCYYAVPLSEVRLR